MTGRNDLKVRLLDPEETDRDPPFAKRADDSPPPVKPLRQPLHVSSTYLPRHLADRGLTDSNSFFEKNWQLQEEHKIRQRASLAKHTAALKKEDNGCGKWFASLFSSLSCCGSEPERNIQDKSYTIF